ncbi:MAG TPA: arylsulfotransferase family protein [Solirubrobacteraceae bacterium]|nr:arylsulfotransferase family protein [Solirubrobacteraceae bacterium]
MPPSPQTGTTRAQFLKRLGGAAGLAALGGASYGAVRLAGDVTVQRPVSPASAPVARRAYASRRDLRPPGVEVTGMPNGYLLLSPSIKGASRVAAEPGALIVDSAGEPVWFRPVPDHDAVTNLAVSRFGGQPVLSWWQGQINSTGYGQGEGVILDAAYRQVASVRAGHGRKADLHELQLTPEGTALITCFPQPVDADLSAVGGPARGQVLENVIQEVDVRSGRVILEWRSLDHVPVTDSYHPVREPFDYLHVNSIDLTPDGHLLISARHTWALYKIHRRTGEVIWTLGGKRSDFSLDRNARFSWQHDARQLSADTISLFDDGSDGPLRTESQSRGLVLALDGATRRVRVQQTYERQHRGLSAAAMGNVQTLAGGNVLVGWGIEPYATEFSPAGRMISDIRMPAGLFSYRAFLDRWTGMPAAAPALAVRAGRRGGVARASWNGATAVTHWRLYLGQRGALRPGPIVPRSGFETAIPFVGSAGAFRAVALDPQGRRLGISPAVRA